MRPVVEETEKGILIYGQSKRDQDGGVDSCEVLIRWKHVEMVQWEIGRIWGKRFLKDLQARADRFFGSKSENAE
jgi:hypothetical protein